MTRFAFFVGAAIVAFAPQPDGIIRLKPSDFRQLPVSVRRNLDRRGCTIPQHPRKTAPHNVISGSFIASGSRDWAVLCSVKGSSRILIYRNGSASRVDSLGRMRDSIFLQDAGNGVMEFSRKIDIASPKSIGDRAKASGAPRLALDHDGIDDGPMEKASTVRYYRRGKWQELLGST
jgi:hypothetical protein